MQPTYQRHRFPPEIISHQLAAEALASQLGLEMVEEKRNILMLVPEEW